jgi:hypothetical protein
MPQSPATLLCLCASHITNIDRVHNLGHLLASVSAQQNKSFKLFLGISFENAEFRKHVEEQLKNNDKNTIHVFLFSKAQAQFERYNSILNALRNKRYVTPEQEPNTYLSFIDDDDLWAPQRMEVFRAGAGKLHADIRSPKYIFTTKHFNDDVENRNFVRWEQLPTDAQNFFEVGYPREYFDIVCKFALFAQFFKVASPELLAHPFCDLALKKWIIMTTTIRDNQQQFTLLRMNCSHPLYFYRKGDRDSRYSPNKQLISCFSETPNKVEEAGSLLFLHTKLSDMS